MEIQRSPTPCGYCFNTWADTRDHLIPQSYGGRTSADNLYPACRRCNSVLSNKVFESIEAKREYIRSELIRTDRWEALLFLPQADEQEQEQQDFLQRSLSLERLGPKEPTLEAEEGIIHCPDCHSRLRFQGDHFEQVDMARGQIPCQQCGKAFLPSRKTQKYCTRQCKIAFFNAKICKAWQERARGKQGKETACSIV